VILLMLTFLLCKFSVLPAISHEIVNMLSMIIMANHAKLNFPLDKNLMKIKVIWIHGSNCAWVWCGHMHFVIYFIFIILCSFVILYFLFFNCRAGVHCGIYKSSYNISNILEYIVVFIKVLTIYHTWIYPFHHSPLSSLPPFLE
jgi:hypothetical protein